MALSPAQIQARIDAIRSARDSGVLIVKHGDTSTTFRSLADMNLIIADLEKDLAKANGVKKSRVGYITQTSKGLGDGC